MADPDIARTQTQRSPSDRPGHGPPSVHVLVPGDLASLTGGYGYDRAVIDGLRSRGWTVTVHALDAGFPEPDASALDATARIIEAVPDGSVCVVDGLAFGVLPTLARAHTDRLRWVALVHHPLALESGLGAARREALMRSEREALASAWRVIATSASTARELAAHYAVPGDRLRVVEPGTDRAPARPDARLRTRSDVQQGPTLLCVATLTPRKGHRLLIEALTRLKDRAWRLRCVGSLNRDPDTVQALREQITAQGLDERVKLLGEVSAADLAREHRAADLFVLATAHEGFGMAVAEALVHGLPIISQAVGALPDLVPPEAGLLLPPGDVDAWQQTLSRLLDDPVLRRRLTIGAQAVGERLPTWPRSIERFAEALQ